MWRAALRGARCFGNRPPGTDAAADAAAAPQFGSEWKREGLPSVSEVQWQAEYGREQGGQLRGVPRRAAAGQTTETQREYLSNRDQLGGYGTPEMHAGRTRTRARYKDWRGEMKAQQREVARQAEIRRGGEGYTDDLIAGHMRQQERMTRTVVDEALVRSFSGVDADLPTVRAVLDRLDGVDLGFSDELIHIADPPCAVLPNTLGSFKDAVRTKLNTQPYTPSRDWYTAADKTVVIVTEDNTAGVDWARLRPDTNFIVISQTVSGFFRTVTAGTVDGIATPANMYFVRTNLPFYAYAEEAIPDESIDEFIFQYPPTFQGGKGTHKRLPDKAFLQLVHPKLKVGGLVRVATSNRRFYDWAHLEFQRSMCEWEERPREDVDTLLSPLVKEALHAAPSGTAVARWLPELAQHPDVAQEWVKPASTSERVHDLNAEYSFQRRNHYNL